jgi:hypothetical protein
MYADGGLADWGVGGLRACYAEQDLRDMTKTLADGTD